MLHCRTPPSLVDSEQFCLLLLLPNGAPPTRESGVGLLESCVVLI
jgi:hypothetical protein